MIQTEGQHGASELLNLDNWMEFKPLEETAFLLGVWLTPSSQVTAEPQFSSQTLKIVTWPSEAGKERDSILIKTSYVIFRETSITQTHRCGHTHIHTKIQTTHRHKHTHKYRHTQK